MRLFKTRQFDRFARREEIDDAALIGSIRRAEDGSIDADLGGGLVKQRVARRGSGRSSGYRVIIAVKFGRLAIFLYGFSKNEISNIGLKELKSLRKAAADLLALNAASIEKSIDDGFLVEVKDGE